MKLNSLRLRKKKMSIDKEFVNKPLPDNRLKLELEPSMKLTLLERLEFRLSLSKSPKQNFKLRQEPRPKQRQLPRPKSRQDKKPSRELKLRKKLELSLKERLLNKLELKKLQLLEHAQELRQRNMLKPSPELKPRRDPEFRLR